MSNLSKSIVKLDEKNTAVVHNAERLCDDLQVSVTSTKNRTKGNAFIIDRMHTGDKIKNKVIVKDNSNSWVGFETHEDPNQILLNSFEKKSKKQLKGWLQNLNLYISIVVPTILLIIFVIQSAVLKNVVILNSNEVTIVILFIVIFLMMQILIELWLRISQTYTANFQLYDEPIFETYNIRIDGEITPVTVLMHRGRYYHTKQTDKSLFGFDYHDIKSLVHDETGSFYTDLIREKEVEKENKVQKYTSFIEERYDQIDEITVKSTGDQSEEETKNIINLSDEIEQYRVMLRLDIMTIEAEITELEEKFYLAIFQAVDRQIDYERAQQIIQADDTISAYVQRESMYAIQVMRQQRHIESLYRELADASNNFDERYYDALANNQVTNVQVSQISYNEQGEEVVSHTTNVQRQRNQVSNSGYNWEKLAGFFIKAILIVGIIGITIWLLIWGSVSIVNAFAGVTVLSVIFILLLFITIISIFIGMSAGFSRFDQWRTGTVKTNLR